MEIKVAKITDIQPYFNNPRDNINAIQPVIKSLEKFGFVKPILVDKDGVIIAGHTRYMASIQIGLDEVPVVYSDMDDERAKQFRLLDNKIGEKSTYNDEELKKELSEMSVPDDMQDFFYENIDSMLHPIDFGSGVTNGADFDPSSFATSDDSDFSRSEENSDDNGYPNDNYYTPKSETTEEKRNEEPPTEDSLEVNNLYKPFTEDGKTKMFILCPYCNNVEKVTLE